MKIVLRKLFVDQIFFSPACIFLFLFTWNCTEKLDIILRNKMIFSSFKANHVKNNVENCNFTEKALKLYIADLFIWPPAQLFNFCYLPTKYRVLFDNLVSLVADTYGSFVCYSNDSNKFLSS